MSKQETASTVQVIAEAAVDELSMPRAATAATLFEQREIIRRAINRALFAVAPKPKPLVWTQGIPKVNGYYFWKHDLSREGITPGVILVDPKSKTHLHHSDVGYWAGPIELPIESPTAKLEQVPRWTCPSCGSIWMGGVVALGKATCARCKTVVLLTQ